MGKKPPQIGASKAKATVMRNDIRHRLNNNEVEEMCQGEAKPTTYQCSNGQKMNEGEQRKYEAGTNTKSTATAGDTQSHESRLYNLLPSQLFRKRKYHEIGDDDDDDVFSDDFPSSQSNEHGLSSNCS
jgi:hypothetical protein